MKKTLFIVSCIVLATFAVSCRGSNRSPGRAYMPDMAYSKAYETYAPAEERLMHDSGRVKPHFNGMPVLGTIARGDIGAYKVVTDTAGTHTSSAQLVNPLDSASYDLKEAERLYLVNCGICHGAKLDGNGPLYNGGNGPYIAKPAVLVGDANIEALTEGQIFHVATFGKGAMGSYASQLSTRQRWMVAAYIKAKQNGAAPADSAATSAPSGATAPADTAKTK